MTTVSRICANSQCKKSFTARKADVRRGWARFCCKSCKAIEQTRETGRGAPTLPVDGDEDWCHPFSEDAFNY